MGSPRKNGNTLILAREAEKALLSMKIETELFFLNDMVLSGCQACYACKKDNTIRCPRNDEMQKMYTAIDHADGVLVTTPIYFGGVTGQTKIWLDRLFPYMSLDLVSNLPKKIPLSCIYTQNQPDESLFIGAISAFEFALSLIGFDVKEHLIAPDLDIGRKPMVSGNPALLQGAYQIGKKLIV